MWIRSFAGVLSVGLAVAGMGYSQQTGQYHVARTVALGGEGSWDYLRVDPDGKRLFIARATRVMVVDLAGEKVVGEIPETPGVHGVAFAPELNRGVTSNGKADTATIFQLDALKAIATVATGGKPDAILWEPFSKTVMTMNGRTNNITVIDVGAGKALGTIALPGRPETAVSDGKGRLFVNLEDKGQIAEVDVAARAVTRTWDLAGCTEPTGLAIDLEHRRLFAACHSGVLIVVDADTGKNVKQLLIGKGVDAAAFDAGTHTVFASNGEGSVSVIAQLGADSYENRETVTTLPGAKTMALDAVHHVVYTVANHDGQFSLLVLKRD